MLNKQVNGKKYFCTVAQDGSECNSISELVEGRVEATERRGRRSKRLLDYLNEKRGYWKSKEEALGRTPRTANYRGGYGPVVR